MLHHQPGGLGLLVTKSIISTGSGYSPTSSALHCDWQCSCKMWVKLWSKDHGVMSRHFKNLTDKHQLKLPAHAPGRWEPLSSCFDSQQNKDISHARWVIIMVIQNSRPGLLLTKPELLKWTKRRRIAAFCMSTTLIPQHLVQMISERQ